MKNMTLEAIARVTHGQLFYPKNYIKTPEREIAGVVNDNRKVQEGYLFVPVIGARVDGHSFIEDVFAKGAYATLSMRQLEDCPGPYILVEDSLKALISIATFYREQLTIPIVGIIGSVGKTSTKEMVSSVLSQRYKVLKTEGNYNNNIGLPLTICSIKEEHTVAVVEMGISDFNEMHELGEIAKPNIVVMTNIGQCHLEQLHTRDGILQAKTEVFDHMPKDGVVILNADDDKLCTADTKGLTKRFYGLQSDYVFAKNVRVASLSDTAMTLYCPAGQADVVIPLPGVHNCLNAMAATAVGVELSLSMSEICAGIESVKTIEGRNNIFTIHGVTVIDDCYNANPVSMKSSIEVLGKATGRTIAVLGDMGELGRDEAMLHYDIAKALDKCGITMLFAVGKLANEYIKGLDDCKASCRYAHYDSIDEMLSDLLPVLSEGDTVLVKASHFMNFSEVVGKIKNTLENKR